MYTTSSTSLINDWGGWLQAQIWDYFSTYTFRYDISMKRSEQHMLRVESLMEQEQIAHTLFWVAESPHNSQQSHLHMLIQGEEAKSYIFQYYQGKGLINPRNVSNEDYDPTLGASFYVSKSLNDLNAAYGMSHYANP